MLQFSNEELVKKNPYDPDVVEGPKLAQEYVELRNKEKEIQNEISDVKDKLVEYSKKFSGEPVYTVQTEDKRKQITIKSTVEKKIPTSTDPLREDLEKKLKEKGVWEEFSMLNSRSINSKINKEKLSDDMQEFFDMYTEEEETREIRQSNVKKDKK